MSAVPRGGAAPAAACLSCPRFKAGAPSGAEPLQPLLLHRLSTSHTPLFPPLPPALQLRALLGGAQQVHAHAGPAELTWRVSQLTWMSMPHVVGAAQPTPCLPCNWFPAAAQPMARALPLPNCEHPTLTPDPVLPFYITAIHPYLSVHARCSPALPALLAASFPQPLHSAGSAHCKSHETAAVAVRAVAVTIRNFRSSKEVRVRFCKCEG